MYRIKQLKFTQQHLFFVTISLIITLKQSGRPKFIGIWCQDYKQGIIVKW